MLEEVNYADLTIALNLLSKHLMQLAKVSDLNILFKACLKVLDEVQIACGDGVIVNVHSDNCDLILKGVRLEEDGLIHRAFLEAN